MKRLLLLALILSPALAPSLRADTALVFNEIMYHPATNEPAMEWVEFRNQLAVDLDVSDWSISGGIDYKFPVDTVVRGRGFIVVAVSPASLMAATGVYALGPFVGRLGNNGDTLRLHNNSGRVVDEMTYDVEVDWPVAPDGSGVSLAKADRDSASAPAANWVNSAQIGGTPGADNFPSGLPVNPTLAFNETAGATNAPFFVELYNHGASPITLDGYTIVHAGDTNGPFVLSGSLEPAGHLALNALGFTGLTAGNQLFLLPPARDRVLDAVVVKTSNRARLPEGTGQWLRPSAPTPGAENTFALRSEIVINEIMYDHALLAPTNGSLPRPSPEAWIELYNRSANTVDLTGWELTGGVSYLFTPGQTIAPGAYLVVADDVPYLRALHPGIDIVGDFGGRLSGSSDHIVLKDPAGNPADEVRYYDHGRWPAYAAGGGSSLELRDPNSDNSKAESWSASDETSKTSWQTYSYRLAANTSGSGQPTTWQDFILGLQAAGECYIDDLSVIESPATAPAEVIANGNFENDLAGWRVLGTHNASHVIAEPGNPGNKVLHLIATDAQEHMHNHIERTLVAGKTITSGREYQISYRARWIAGNNLLNTRLYFNRSGRTTALPRPPLNGTPGAQNSRFVANAGPTFSQFSHTPVVPPASQPVTVTVAAADPQGVASCEVFWSFNGGAWSSATMTRQAGDTFTGTIPGQTAGTVVQFYVRATDTAGAAATFPARGTNSGALYKVADGQADLNLAHNFRIILTPANIDLLHGTSQGVNQTNVMSNELLPCTIIYDEQRAYYDAAVHLHGSQRGRYSDNRTGFHIEFQPDDLFRGVHPIMLIDRSGAGDATGNRQEEIIIKHILNRAGGIPGNYSEICRLLAPRSIHNGPAQFFPRHEDNMLKTLYPNGADGQLFEMELIYFPTTANAAGYKNQIGRAHV